MKKPLLGRVFIGLLLAPAVFLATTHGPVWLIAVVTAAWATLATLEFVRLLQRAGVELNEWFLAALNLSVVGAGLLNMLPAYLLAPVGAAMVVAVLTRETKPRVPVYSVFTILYLGFLPAHLVMLKHACDSASLSSWLVSFPLLLTWTGDTAAWGIGLLFGRHKLMPELSPAKTWEGFGASLVASGLLAALLLPRFAPFGSQMWPRLALYGIGLGTVAQVGDLFESIFKRAVGVKDASNALGEHGGFLDRIDSLLFVIPAWHYLIRLYLQ